MRLVLTGMTGGYLQLVTVLLLFVLVLAVTAAITKWMAGSQRQQASEGNVEVIETHRISNNKYIQIVRVGKTYMVIAVCKDTVTLLGQVPEEELRFREAGQHFRFKEILDRAVKGNAAEEETEESRDHDEQ